MGVLELLIDDLKSDQARIQGLELLPLTANLCGVTQEAKGNRP